MDSPGISPREWMDVLMELWRMLKLSVSGVSSEGQPSNSERTEKFWCTWVGFCGDSGGYLLTAIDSIETLMDKE
ncbi:hypothetical protein RUM43_011339 [Polyplax serrata]|uniref:Uncharacterized protein n=1 Tax=Polyplax serrata TaxID=468196 RepID=A0AAN8P6X9_POLSC